MFLLMVTVVKGGLLDSVVGGWSFGFTGFVPPRGCELYVGGHNPGFAIMGVGGSDLSGVGYAVMDLVVYNGRLYVASVLVVVVERVYMYNGVGGDGLDRGVFW
jgi:hypothetical protein